jgi:hypothetical protein
LFFGDDSIVTKASVCRRIICHALCECDTENIISVLQIILICVARKKVELAAGEVAVWKVLGES